MGDEKPLSSFLSGAEAVMEPIITFSVEMLICNDHPFLCCQDNHL